MKTVSAWYNFKKIVDNWRQMYQRNISSLQGSVTRVNKYTPFWRGAFIFFYCHSFHWSEYQIMSKLGRSTQYCKITVKKKNTMKN